MQRLRNFNSFTVMHSLHGVHEMNADKAGHVCMSTCFNSRTTGHILIKYDMDIMPMEANPNSYFF
jgi:hypothetical protein